MQQHRLVMRPWLSATLAIAGTMPVQNALAESPLFASESVLELSMPVDFETLCRPSEDASCDFTATVFEWHDSDGAQQSLAIEVKRRDGWRALHTNCQIPTLFVRFDAEQAAGSPFAGQTTLALTSHCGKGIVQDSGESATLPDQFERYVINEYLGYRLYNLFTDDSLKVRLARITYVHPDNPRRTFTHDAFFAEHFESLAERRGARLIPVEQFELNRLDRESTARLALFQYMIGNTDWSLDDEDNIILLRNQQGVDTPVLYDLDQSGLVNAHYAQPNPGLPIGDVTERYFLGFCESAEGWDRLFSEFAGKRAEILGVLSEMPRMGRGDRRMTGVFLDEFFDIIASEQSRQERIVANCQPWPATQQPLALAD